MEILKEVFDRLTKNNLELRLSKCEFFQTEIKYLGNTVDGYGIKGHSRC